MASDRLKIYTDEHVPKAVAEGLRRRGIDVLRAQEAGMRKAQDTEHLKFAEIQGRVVLTQDTDFLRLHKDGVSHCGIIYVRQQSSVGNTIQGVMLVYEALTPGDMTNHVEFL